MAYEIAKLLLEHAETADERQAAIEKAIDLGMPLYEIEEYLDWLQSIRNLDWSPPSNESSRAPKRKEP